MILILTAEVHESVVHTLTDYKENVFPGSFENVLV